MTIPLQMDLPFDDAPNQQRVAVDYPVMVRNLFKRSNYHNVQIGPSPQFASQDGASLMHAAIGVCGEAFELCQATDTNHIKEEMGDILFYCTAMMQVLDDAGVGTEDQLHQMALNYASAPAATMQGVANEILELGHSLLDTAKRVWVYGNVFEDHAKALVADIGMMLGALTVYATRFGFDMDEVREGNQRKLGRRYPDGVYSNESATARADKAKGE